ncbi:MAG TPA: hypothetical protein VFQ17_15135 [Nocardioides sp.]|nr:hypothetical protein [Nocardioides sp.]
MSGQADPVSGRRVVDASVYSVEFKPRGTGRRVVGFLTLVCLAATAYFGWQAYEERTPISFGVAATLGALTIVLWAAWAASPVSHLHVHGGILEVQRAGRTERFDLTSHYTIIRVQGSPRSSRWKVLIDRPANTPFVIDRTMVDPKAFMRVLNAYHHGVS